MTLSAVTGEMREFSASVRIACTPQQAFDLVADYRNARRVLEGVTRWEPVDHRTRGAGTRWNVEMRTFGVPLSNRLLIDRWDEPRAIGWHSESGLIGQRGGWSFRPVGAETEATLRIAYEPPGAAVGNLLASRTDAVVRRRLQRALEAMKELLEAGE
jgi:uncharacterized membrane protein